LLKRDDGYLARVAEHGTDIDSLSEGAFAAAVLALQRRHPPPLAFWDRAVAWEHSGDGELPYRAQVDGRALTVRVNDFPAQALYTLIVDGAEIADLEDWPAGWARPAIPQALLDLVAKARKRP